MEVEIKMIPKMLKMLMVSLVLTISVSAESAMLEWEIQRTLKLDAPPLDMAIAPDGKSVYILADKGEVQIYDLDGHFKDKIEIDI